MQSNRLCSDIKRKLAVEPSWLVMQHALRQELVYHQIMWAIRYNHCVLKIYDEDGEDYEQET